MIKKLDDVAVADRLNSFTHDQYQYIYALIKGVALATAAFVLTTLLDDASTLWPRLWLWIASFCALLVTHVTTARGQLLVTHKYNLGDSLLPIILGLLEFLLFTILQPNNQNPMLWFHWYSVFALWAFCAGVIVWVRKKQIDPQEDYNFSLVPLAWRYTEWLRLDQRSAFRVGIGYTLLEISIVLFNLHDYNWFVQTGQIVIGIFTSGVMAYVIWQTEVQRKEVIDFIFQIESC